MTTSTLFHTQGIRGFKYEKTHRKNGTEYYYVRSSAVHVDCPLCGSAQTVIVNTSKTREIRGLHIGLKKLFLESKFAECFVQIAVDVLKRRLLFARDLT